MTEASAGEAWAGRVDLSLIPIHRYESGIARPTLDGIRKLAPGPPGLGRRPRPPGAPGWPNDKARPRGPGIVFWKALPAAHALPQGPPLLTGLSAFRAGLDFRKLATTCSVLNRLFRIHPPRRAKIVSRGQATPMAREGSPISVRPEAMKRESQSHWRPAPPESRELTQPIGIQEIRPSRPAVHWAMLFPRNLH